ncbi:nuclease [Bacillus sp. LK10]|uniref:3'-5' exonuclease n=1 Tax=Bacillus sp. LK10 TaxID=1628211 RepID=UPI00064E4677|nr:nuclease-related domain-containing DEAD/DEAH box helicase [Bacillus sp. LK10]KML15568.1 nuclease [Bacillus stratosphericus]KML62211.1 nuclease [Bacillus stratosphericus]KMN29642.1 nuclease [Bacillus stratosphericus]KMN75383.1 nuclease [Bacillus sp. LK10]
MAITLPETIKNTATAGERILFRTLKEYLPEEYIVHYEPNINGFRPDFVIIGPNLGVLVLEVKDYTKNTIRELNDNTWGILNSSGDLHRVKSPLVQSREYAFKIKDMLEKDIDLINTEGKYQFKLKFPYGYGVVFTRLHEEQLLKNKVYEVIDPHFILSRDQIDPDNDHFDPEILIEKLFDMFHVPFKLYTPLSSDELERIRYHLYKEIRVGADVEPVPYQEKLLLSFRNIKTMDLHQENLAKQIGDKHRLIRGVAGSGKTLILATRAKMLAEQHPNWKILILCYNVALKQNIKQMIHSKFTEPDDFLTSDHRKTPNLNNIQILNFHHWIKKDHGISELEIDDYIEKIENDALTPVKYDAILIDEGQDFEGSWLHLISLCLDQETQSLLLVEDRAQDIYRKSRSYVKDTGLDFRGRSRILNINYRNTSQIVDFGWKFYDSHRALDIKLKQEQTETIEIIPPKKTKRKGPEVELLKCNTFKEEIEEITKQIVDQHNEKNIPYSEMAILYRIKGYNNHYISAIQSEFLTKNIPYNWITENGATKHKFNPEEETVKICSLDSSKGLDFHSVFIVKADLMPLKYEEDQEKEVSLMYIGMTRAKEYLSISYSGVSSFTQYFEDAKQKEPTFNQ